MATIYHYMPLLTRRWWSSDQPWDVWVSYFQIFSDHMCWSCWSHLLVSGRLRSVNHHLPAINVAGKSPNWMEVGSWENHRTRFLKGNNNNSSNHFIYIYIQIYIFVYIYMCIYIISGGHNNGGYITILLVSNVVIAGIHGWRAREGGQG